METKKNERAKKKLEEKSFLQCASFEFKSVSFFQETSIVLGRAFLIVIDMD